MKALWINAADKTIEAIDCDGLEEMQSRVGGYIEAACRYPHGNVLFVDEEGLFKRNQVFFRIARLDRPMAGNGLMVGSDDDGETADVKLRLDQLVQMVEFRTRAQVDSWAKAHASDPAISFQAEGEEPEVFMRIGKLFGDLD